ncbi:MAG: ROK family protein [Armatimonadota bacterium]
MAGPRQLIAGVDVGGTKIAAGLSTREGKVIASDRVPTPQAAGHAVLTAIIELLRRLCAEAKADSGDLAAIGVSVPAVTDQARGAVLWAPNIPGWDRETLVAGPISEAIGAHTSLHYDGHAWVAGEWWLGAARGARDVALLAVGTGIGGGLILDGKLHRGRVGVAGAVGWWVPDYTQAGQQRRHREGLLESIASGPAIARAAGQPTAEEAFAAARQGDPTARRAIADAASALGAAVASLVSLLDPEVVVLAGGVITGGGDLILPRVQEIVANEAQPQAAPGVRIVPAALGENAAWLGAARLASEREAGVPSLAPSP